MSDKLLLDLPVVLPDAVDARDLCVERLMSTLKGAPGLDQVHLIDEEDRSPARLCLHYDPAAVSVARVRSLAVGAGTTLTLQFGHVIWAVEGIGHVRKARSVATELRRLEGVIEAEVTPGLVRVEFDRRLIDEARLLAALQELRVAQRPVDVNRSGLDQDAAESHDGHNHGNGSSSHEGHDHGGPFGEKSELIFAITSAALWVIGFILDLLAPNAAGTAITGIFIGAAFFGGYFTLREAIDSIRAKRFEIDFLMLVAAAGAAILGKFEEGALLLALFSSGHALEGFAMGRARRAIESLAELAPSTALVRYASGEKVVPVEELQIGDIVIVKPNERIPADGFVIAGITSVDQAALTGESIPVYKSPVEDAIAAAANPDSVSAASRLLSGTMNGAGQVDLQVTRLASESTLSRLATMVREAETQASPTQRFTDRFERIFVPAVIALVIAVSLLGPVFGSSWSESFYRAMAVLVAASPCALAIATPSAVLAAVARAGQFGVLIKGGGPLENLGSLRAIAFDKTGTLTEGQPRLTDVRAAYGVLEAELLSVAIAVESRSDHPLATAVVRDGSVWLGRKDVAPASEVTAIVGRGVSAVVDGDEVLIGSLALFSDYGAVDAAVREDVARLQADGRTIMVVKRGSRVLGTIGLMDTPRADARGAISALSSAGIRRAIMLSGDHQLVAASIAKDVGLKEAWGDLMPEDKVAAIERLRKEEGKVAMVGDGVNDAPALAHATVGIAMGAAGSDVALETADIALMSDDLSKLPVVIGLSRMASRVIRQNLLLSLGMVAFLIPATIVGFVGIGPAVVFHEGSTLVVVANALRLLAYGSPKGPGERKAAAK